MFTITGKQKFGAVWVNGKCIAYFKNGVATTNDPAVADIMRAKGYTVTDKAPKIDPKGKADQKDNKSSTEGDKGSTEGEK